MPHISQIRKSNYLSKGDLANGPIVVTIDQVFEDMVEFDGKSEPKFIMSFFEEVKPLILNAGNAQDVALWLGSEQTEDWHGRQIVIYHDPSVKMGGKLVGGIRTQAYNPNQAIPPQPHTHRQVVQQMRQPAGTRPGAQVQRPQMQPHSNQAEYDASRAASRTQHQPRTPAPGHQVQPRPQQVYQQPHQNHGSHHDAFDPNDGGGDQVPFDQVGNDGAPQ